jgi:hypothetical protein
MMERGSADDHFFLHLLRVISWTLPIGITPPCDRSGMSSPAKWYVSQQNRGNPGLPAFATVTDRPFSRAMTPQNFDHEEIN